MTNDQVVVYKKAFYDQAANILMAYPIELELFNKYWNDANYRHAYLVFHEAFAKHSIDEQLVDKQIDSDFYWYFVN